MQRVARLGSYDLVAELAVGGMAAVFVARQHGASGVERLVVLKRVHPHLLRQPQFRSMFREEARMASLVRHPNVVPLLDVVETDDELTIVLEFVESVSLASVLHTMTEGGIRMPVPVAVRIVADVLAGLHAAHEAVDVRGRRLEIVHRDVSPQNIILGVDGAARLIDFGIAKAALREFETSSGVLKGKLAYMSPEQARGDVVDRRSDVFAAGVVLFEALTQQRLFGGGGGAHEGMAILREVLEMQVPAPSTVRAEVSASLDAVTLRALERSLEARFPSADDFHEALLGSSEVASSKEVAALVEAVAGKEIASRRSELRRRLEEATAIAWTATPAPLTRPLAGALRSADEEKLDTVFPSTVIEIPPLSTALGAPSAAPPRRTPPERTWPVWSAGVLLLALVGAGVALRSGLRVATGAKSPEPPADGHANAAPTSADSATPTAPSPASTSLATGAPPPESAIAPAASAAPPLDARQRRAHHLEPAVLTTTPATPAPVSPGRPASSLPDLHPDNPY